MKHIVIMLILIGFVGIAHAQYMGNIPYVANPSWPPVCLGGPEYTCPVDFVKDFLNKAIGDPFEKSDIVVVGKIIEAQSFPEQNITQYNVGVQYYLKNEKPHDLLNVIGDGILPKEFPGSEVLVFNRPIFEKNDRVFLYLVSKDGKYHVSPYSFLLDNNIPRGPPPEHVVLKNKNTYFAGEKIAISGMIQKGNLYLSVAEHNAKPEVKIRFENSTNQPFFEDIVDVKPDGTFTYMTNFSTKNAKTGGYSFSIDVGFSSTGSSFSYYASPLKQFREGIPIEEITCKENLVLVTKSTNDSPACIKSSTGNKLLDRGWIKCTGSIIEVRGHPCGPRSSGAMPTPSFSNQVIIPKGSANPGQKIPLVPHTVTIILAENNTVIWTNQDDSPATLVADDGSWTTGLIEPGDSVTILFNHTGAFNYHGEPHPWNTGKIIVLDTDNLTMQVVSSDVCSWATLEKIPQNGLTKRKDWFGANALIMKIGDDELNPVPHLKEMINEMKNSSGFTLSEFDKNIVVKQISGAGVNHGKILDWLRENFEKQFPPRGDGAYSSFFQYDGDIYTVKVAQC